MAFNGWAQDSNLPDKIPLGYPLSRPVSTFNNVTTPALAIEGFVISTTFAEGNVLGEILPSLTHTLFSLNL